MVVMALSALGALGCAVVMMTSGFATLVTVESWIGFETGTSMIGET
jgi:hypothetical protein